jgi:hypothetical protein
VVYILSYERFVTVDAAAHIGTAAHLVDELTGSGADVGRLLEPNLAPAPNLLAGFLLTGLVWLAGIEWSERLLLLGYVVSLPAATWGALRSAGPRSADLLAFFALPLTFSFTFLYGFLNFSYSVVLFLVAAGVILRSGRTPTPARSLALSALLVVIFFTHLIGYLEAALLLLIVAGTQVAFARRTLRPQARHVALALLPTAGLTIWFLASSGSADANVWVNPVRKLAGIVSLDWALGSYDRLEWVFCVVAAGALWLLALLAVRRAGRSAVSDPMGVGLALFVIASTAVAVASPEEVASGGSYLSQRLALFPAFGGLLWLARLPLGRREVLAGAAAAVVAGAGLLVVRHDELRSVARIAVDLDPLTACVEERSFLVQANLSTPRFGSLYRLSALGAETGRVTARTNSIYLGNIDWAVPFSVFRFRPEADPYVHLVDPGAFLEDAPPPFDFARFERTGIPVDAVLVFGRPGADAAMLASAGYRRFARQLRERFTQTALSPEGWWELWISKERGASTAPCTPREG